MNIFTVETWDDVLWQQAKRIYNEAFGNKDAKSEKIIRNMFDRGIAQLHVMFVETRVVALAITGHLKGENSLIIDYLAVGSSYKQRGYGSNLVNYIGEWAVNEKKINRIFIEVECEETVENLERILFWKKCGFMLTNYVHRYKWVPETYKGMYLLLEGDDVTIKGEDIFDEIGKFHRISFRK
ncbi:GNAT family N-acetyltransferase [Bacillus luteolus]|uniref:GNAT family N-acetyltransferase n=1 Tax=Litchfieldia luteola TaxID=682179 RepID=A0ABR9QH29_9BACI|nr:GNAT family N-acetyltransferase [Cytobacillus luteolus]MBE4907780.1 GNAT family N-acetyltransferase [Cytobacillus luteolus]MBP1944129.1 GNAT superfamily N-acetyltransferase [Cytobacillus luteolus]